MRRRFKSLQEGLTTAREYTRRLNDVRICHVWQYAFHLIVRNMRLWCALMTIACLSLIFNITWYTILNHGVILPGIADWKTKAFETTMVKENKSSIPPKWRPDFRVIVSLSTVPHHIHDLSETIASLLDQSLKPDAIYLNIPFRSSRTKEAYEIPPYLHRLDELESAFTILRSEMDYGPLTKLYPVLEQETDGDTLIITVDDDKVYPKNMVSTIAWYSHHHPDIAWGDCGWSFLSVPHSMEVVPVYVPINLWHRWNGGREVEVLQAVCGNGYRRSFFDGPDIAELAPAECFTTDDLWISGYLKFVSNVLRVLIKEDIQPQHTKWKQAQLSSKWDLSTVNSANENDIKCIRAIERLVKQTWF